MNQQFIGRVAAAVLFATVLNISDRANAQSLDARYDEALEVSATDQSLESASTDTLRTFLRSTTTVRVNAHTYENRQAATVYIKDIPVLTYIDPVETANVVSGWLPPSDMPVAIQTHASVTQADGAITDAAAIAAQLEQMGGDNPSFTARWQEGRYVVMAGEKPLITLSDTVQLPDATDDVAEDVLQITNRLRRLLGNETTGPITQIVGRPAHQREQRVAAVRSSYSGMASWYGPGFHGRQSASGEAFNQYAMTAAHRTLPFGTQVRVTNLNNGRQVVVRINDRGPYSHNRIIDLSAGAASAIGLQSAGVGPVQIEVLPQSR